jgi:DHA1 family multidrug resistance protein-like MFS transporter
VTPSRGRADWRRNQVAVTVATFIGFTGFTLVMPFLPLYFEQLGVHDPSAIAIWSGLSLGVTPAVTAAMAPVWARVADRFGRKLMVARSLFFFIVTMVALAYVWRPWQVFALRAVLGFFAGYGPIAMTMAAESAPAEQMASALGWVQTAQRLGPALGPVLGGALAQTVGLRAAFLVASGFYVLAFALVVAGYRDVDAATRHARRSPGDPVSLRSLRLVPHFLLFMGTIFGLQLIDRSFAPVLPLYLREVGITAARVPVMSGIIFTIAAGAAAIGNQSSGLLLSRLAARSLVPLAAAIAACAALAFGEGLPTTALLAASMVFGLGIGVATTAVYTLAGRAVSPEARGVAFGYLTTAYLVGLAVSPVVAGFIGARSMRAVFFVDAIGLAGLAWAFRRRMTF